MGRPDQPFFLAVNATKMIESLRRPALRKLAASSSIAVVPEALSSAPL